MMPIMDGFQFRSEQLKNPRHAKVRVIIFTADGHAKEIGADLGAVASISETAEDRHARRPRPADPRAPTASRRVRR
jgi:hypothetical protein